MKFGRYAALAAALGAVTLMLDATAAFAGSAVPPRAGFAATHAMSRPAFAPPFRHHHRFNGGAFWPAEGDFGYEPSYGEPMAAVPQSPSGDVHYTYSHDVPWDWAHRYPPNVTPSDHPYVSSCPSETVTVPGRDGKEQTVNVMRCY